MKKGHKYSAISAAILLAVPVAVLAQETQLANPFGEGVDGVEPIQLIAVITQALLGIVGAGTLLMFVWGGMMMIFASGNEEKISKGKDILMWSSIGLVIVLTSYSILTFLFNLFQRAATGS